MYYVKRTNLIEQIEVTGAAVQTLDFATTLDGDADRGYMMEWWIKNGAAATVIYSLRLNGAAAAGTRQRITAGTSTIAGAYVSGAVVGTLATNAGTGSQLITRVTIPFTKSGGLERFAEGYHSHIDASTNHPAWGGNFYHFTTPAVGVKITGVGLSADTAAGIGVGTIGRLWRI